ncbi:prepilin-type N-terminal cleavage/methylation domain-containing protein [Virgibacillus alimentarius]|uniref:prepilin-type N-terminal cleavage/methylation domain-containing protein n=1 Tax=Virgibacillus alimentarius TaxID=698769 RepID=UPI0004930CCF|nr:prepilin-type N-terminal cleavage/methylation domain-containing protein [Virgibacillus alimentarius]
MNNNKGFTLIEVLVASSIIFTIVSTTVPITSLLLKEREILSDRRIITSRLHDELQPFLWEKKKTLPSTFIKTISETPVKFHFSYKEKLIKGCAEWENVKERNEKICIYGLLEK